MCIRDRYKDCLLNKIALNSVRSYVTAARGLLNYAHRMGWIPENISKIFHNSKAKNPVPIKPIPPEIEHEVLNGDWGKNSLNTARNKLIACLIMKRGLTPMEFGSVLEEHIKPLGSLGYITVFGKNKKSRDVVLDIETLEALRIYMLERAHYLRLKRINTQQVFLSLNPQSGSYAITGAGVMAVLRQIKTELRLRGYVFDLSGLTSRNCRKVAIDKSYKQTNQAKIPHVDLTLSGQHGYGIGGISDHNRKAKLWQKSLKNAGQIMNHIEEKVDSNTERRVASLQGVFPEASFFNNFGIATSTISTSRPLVWSSTRKKLQESKPDRTVLREQLDKLGYPGVAELYNTTKANIRKWSGNYVVRGIQSCA